MGYSDEPLSEHSLTGTRNRPLNQETQEGQGRVGREAQRHECVTTPMPTNKCVVRPQVSTTHKAYTHVTTSY